ncbi:TRAP transporter solute receptor, TAXI family [Pseudodesulfovibrio mercurii]|uniref:TRAP transporter solute receptor, TAXI family n=1 Tax=Pseudodesulfovibrio mercurii TaxID=641491 RepID=F0JDG6_9BACT|nr:TAXI family TRAP transporter solute-binding subunit [Pseudodesulfovibrio mercurii]EGB13335.1 TRAP transporter solute receptor, TAXI family [Pseudodesulfovibrio mercurii]
MTACIRAMITAAVLLVSAGLLAACGDAPSRERETSNGKPAAADSSVGTLKASKPVFATIGTGGISGVYYPTGGAIANMVNLKRDTYNVRLTVESTGGSVFNINSVIAGDLQFGIAQADRQFQAVHGIAEWRERGPQTKLRAVFSMHPETVTLVAGEDTGIRDIRDLKGHRVNIGNPGSGQHQNSLDALEAAGLALTDIEAVEIKAMEAIEMLEAGTLDAFFYTVGHPSAAILKIARGKRKVRIVPITGVDSLFILHPYYVPSRVNMKYYPDAADAGRDVESFGVKATLVTSVDVPDPVVYAVTREVFENFETFKAQQPAFADLTKMDMLQGLSAPIHPGAARYYREAGLQ